MQKRPVTEGVPLRRDGRYQVSSEVVFTGFTGKIR